MNRATRLLSFDREGMTELERSLFMKDLKRVTDEYFETEGNADLEVTRSEDGFLVCVIFGARRIKTVRRPGQ